MCDKIRATVVSSESRRIIKNDLRRVDVGLQAGGLDRLEKGIAQRGELRALGVRRRGLGSRGYRLRLRLSVRRSGFWQNCAGEEDRSQGGSDAGCESKSGCHEVPSLLSVAIRIESESQYCMRRAWPESRCGQTFVPVYNLWPWWPDPVVSVFFVLISFLVGAVLQVHAAPASWRGTLRDAEGHPVANASIELHCDFRQSRATRARLPRPEISPSARSSKGLTTLRVTVPAKAGLPRAPSRSKKTHRCFGRARTFLNRCRRASHHQRRRQAHARQRRRKSFERRGLEPPAERARLQQTAAARRRHDDGHERRRELHAAIRRQRAARRRPLYLRRMESIRPTRNSAARRFRISMSMRFRKCSPAPA